MGWVVMDRISGIETVDDVEVVGDDGGQGLWLAEAGVSRSPVVVVDSVLCCFIIGPAGRWAFYWVPPTSNGYGFFLECFDLSHVEELETGGDADVDGYGVGVVIQGFWS